MTKPIKPLSEQIEEYKNDSMFTKIFKEWNHKTQQFEPKTKWNWDESWDGQLIKDVTALEQAGFTIVSFSRKRKVTLKVERNIETGNAIYSKPERWQIVESICYAVGDTWYSISLKPTLSIYWKGRSSSWRY